MNNSLLEKIQKQLENISDTPYLDALFFMESFGVNEPTPDEIADFLKRRAQQEPVSKIIGRRGFWALDFKVSQDVLDPRPDSETIIETVLKSFPDKEKPYQILDIGTGSGCLLVSLLYEYKNAHGLGVDISLKALEIAQENAKGYQADFLNRSFYDADFTRDLAQYDIIVSNPPYIKTNDINALDDAVKKYDPLLALDGGEDGLSAYRALAKQIKNILKPDGKIFFEIGQGQEKDVILIMQKAGFQLENQVKDLGGIIRVLSFSL